MQTKEKKSEQSHQQWLEERQKGIGGSDSAAICLKVVHKGRPYEKTVLDVYFEKVEPVQEKQSSIAIDLGKILEPYIIEMFLKENPDWAAQPDVNFASIEYDFLRANIDAIVTDINTGETAVLECKTTDSTMKSYWENEVPLPYYLQVQHYLAVTGYQRGFIAVLFGNRGYQQYEITRDDELINTMIHEHYIPFWDCVKTKTPPELEGDALTLNAVKKAYPEAKEPGIFLGRECESVIKEYLDVNDQIKELSGRKDELQAQLIAELKEAEAGMLDNYIVSYKNRTGIDTERLLAEKPEVFQKYKKPTLNTTEFRKKEKELAKEYATVTGRTFSVKEK